MAFSLVLAAVPFSSSDSGANGDGVSAASVTAYIPVMSAINGI